MTAITLRWTASTLLFVFLLAALGICSAQAQVKDFDVPAQSATTGIPEFARQAGIQILVSEPLVRGKSIAAVTGPHSVREALTILLKGTGLIATSKDGTTYTVAPASAATTQTTSPSAMSMGNAGGLDSKSEPLQKDGLEEIVVTGTHISGVQNKTIPLLTFDKEAIDRSGYASLSDFISSLPQNVKSGNNSADGILAGVSGYLNNLENSTAANLRGLGAGSTLTLIDGHRMAASAFGTGVDLSMIPLSAVDHVDVLTDGSSAVYGSDAVGGVINVILRKDFNGEETRARLDTLSRGGGELKQLGQSVGRTWGSGNALLVFQFEDDNPIRSDQRSFTANLAKPTDVLPIAKRYSAVLTSHQDLAPSFELFADGLFEHDGGNRSLAFTSAKSQVIDNSTDSGSVNLGFRWQALGDWRLEGSGLFSRVNTLTRGDFTPPQPPYVNGDPYIRAIDTVKEIDLKLDGTVWSNGSSSLKAAVGGSTREEQFAANTYYASGGPSDSRHVTAVFAELYAPLITAANALPFVRKLELSAAVRDDSYSDFGSRIDPRFGVFIAPIDQLGLRVAYSTSFRAPNPFELLQASSVNTIYIESGFAQPNDPTGATPALFVGNRVLKPETSRNLTVGLEFAPDTLPNTHFSLNYYRIIYSNRIIAPPVVANIFLNPQVYGSLIRQFPDDAAVAAYVAGIQPPEPVFDLSPGQTGLAGVRYGYTYGVINAAREKTEGLDVGARSVIDLGSPNKLNLEFNATYLRDLQTTFCDTCTSTDLANTYGEPLKLRLRASGGWSNGILSSNAAVNFVNGYSDTNVVPDGHIRSFTTLDLNAGLTLRSTGTYLSVNILNALNSSPPSTSPAFLNVAYDPTNADPRGRTLSLQVRQTW